jgi:hypothetical protein
MCTTIGTLLADYRFLCVYSFVYSYGWITHGFLRDPRHVPSEYTKGPTRTMIISQKSSIFANEIKRKLEE